MGHDDLDEDPFVYVLKNTFTCGARSMPVDDSYPFPAPAPAQAENDLGAQVTGSTRGAELQAAAADDSAVQQARGVHYVVGQSPTRLSTLLGRCVIRSADNGNIKGAVRLLRMPLRMGCPRLAANVMDSMVCLQGRPDVLASLIAHLMAERDMGQSLQLIIALLRHRKVEVLCALCCEMEKAGHVAQMATLLAEAARRDYHEELAALMLYLVREGHLDTARDIVLVMLVNGHEDTVGLVFLHMLQWGGAKQVATIGIALADVSAIALLCNAERALVRWELARGVPAGTVVLTIIKMGRADVVAKVLIELDEQRQVEFVVRALQGLKTEEAVEATVQVSQALASMDRPDIVADIKVALVEHEHLDITVACVKSCIQGGLAWVAAALALELLRKGKLDVETEVMKVIAEEGRVDLLAKWMGVLVRGGHEREWTEIAGELHRRGLFWTVADIIAELVPTGRAAVDAHKALYDYLGPQYVFSSPDAILCAEVHILMIDRGNLDKACQLTAAAVINSQSQVVLDVMTSIINDKDRADIVAKKVLRLLETGHTSLVVALNNALIQEGRFAPAVKLAAAMADIAPEGVIDLLDKLRDAGATIMPEVWHYITAAQFTPGVVVPPAEAQSPQGVQFTRIDENGPEVVREAVVSTGPMQGVVPEIRTPASFEVPRPQTKSSEESQRGSRDGTGHTYAAPTAGLQYQPGSPTLRARVVRGPQLIIGEAHPDTMQGMRKRHPGHTRQPISV